MRERQCYACLEVYPHLRPHTTRRCPLKESAMVRGKRVAHAPQELVPRKRMRSRGTESPPPPPVDHQLDIRLLESLICTEYFQVVYQCLDGHVMRTCARCWPRIHSTRCPTCKQPLNTRKCTLFDKIVGSLLKECRHKEDGCTEMLQCNKQRLKRVKRICERMPEFMCPCQGCTFYGDKFTLPGHLGEKHEVPTVNLEEHSNHVSFKLDPEDRMVMVKGVEPDTTYLLHREFKDGFRGEIFFLTSFGVNNKVCILHVIENYEQAKLYSHANLVVDVRCADESREESYLFHPFSEKDTCAGYQIDIDLIHAPEAEEEHEEADEDRATTSGEAPGASA